MVIMLTGPNTFRSHLRLHQLRQAFCDKYDPRGFATTTLAGPEVTLEAVRDAIGSGGLFSSHRFVALDNLPNDLAQWPAIEKTLIAVTKDDERIVVIRQTEEKKMTGKKKARPAAGVGMVAGAKIETFPLLTDIQLRNAVMKEVKSQGGSMTPAVAAHLIERTNSDEWRLAQETEKLLAASAKKPITMDMVDEYVAAEVRSDIFRLTDALGNGMQAVAIRQIHTELAAGTHPLVLVATLMKHVQTLWRVRHLLDRKKVLDAEVLGIHPYVLQKATRQVKHITEKQLTAWHRRLLDLDRNLKTSPLDAETLLNRFITSARL